MVNTITLLGDSILDNGRYVGNGPTVFNQVQSGLPDWRLDRRATDGASALEVLKQQLARPLTSGHVVVSAGGNDALNAAHTLDGTAGGSVAQLWDAVHEARAGFRADYRLLLDRLQLSGCKLAVCTIYNPNFDREEGGSTYQRFATCGVALFNDVILHEALRRELAILDLRDVCCCEDDFANPIEPSSRGGQKIANAICRWAASA